MLQVKDLTIRHKKDLTTLVDHLSFSLAPGYRAAIIGEEGNGKSSILKLLYDPALIDSYAEWTGEVEGQTVRKGYLAQELGAEDLALPIIQFCQDHPGFEAADPKMLAQVSTRVGLDSGLFYDWRSLSTLSGGERVKLRLALLLLEEPDVLLLDEPSNDLDVETLSWLEDFLLSCPVPVLYISHDERLLEQTANLIIHLERLSRRTQPRATVARMDYQSYVSSRQSAFQRQEQRARKEKAEFDGKMDRYSQIRGKVERQQAAISRQDPYGGQRLKQKMHTVQSMGRRFEREKADMTPMPQWERAIIASFDHRRSVIPAGKTVLRFELPELAVEDRVLARGIRLWVTGAEKIGIVGSNGAGKSTLLKRLAEELLSRVDLRAVYMPQNYDEGLLGDKTPVELLAPSGERADVTRARTLLGSMQYTAEEMDHPAHALSGGQRAKLLYLSMVLQGANVLVLDEPTRNFSPISAAVIRRALAEFPGCIISVSHDRLYLEEVCTRILELGAEGLVEK